MKNHLTLALAVAPLCMLAVAADAQVAPGIYIGSVEYQNVCSNGGQGSSASPARLTVSNRGALTYLFTTIYSSAPGAQGQPISEGGFSLTNVDPNGHWSAQNLIYGGGYNGYSTQAGTWTQTFTTSDGVVSATGTFDIVVSGQVVCSEPTSAVFIAAPKGS
jgi:hypothetical protein